MISLFFIQEQCRKEAKGIQDFRSYTFLSYTNPLNGRANRIEKIYTFSVDLALLSSLTFNRLLLFQTLMCHQEVEFVVMAYSFKVENFC